MTPNLVKTISMTTVEIAEQTGKRPDHVKRDAERMLLELHGETGLLFYQESYINTQNKKQPCYRLPKREVLILVSGYSISLLNLHTCMVIRNKIKNFIIL